MPLRSLITRAADELHDAVLRQTIGLLRVAAGQSRTALGLLEKLENKLVGDLNNVLGKSPRAGKLRALLSETQASIGDVYATIAETHTAQLGEIAGATMADMERVEARILRVPITRAEPTAAELEKLANKTLIQGRYAKEWWGQQKDATQDRLTVKMREGLLRGETIDELARRVRGTKAVGYADSVLRQSRTNAEAIIRTSAITVGNAARLQHMVESPITNGILWVSVIDSRTSNICLALSGKQWSLPDYKPLGHIKPFPGPAPHTNCFTGDVSVSSPSGARALYRRAYSGELITLETDGIRSLTATPNHPVLTPSGWLPIRELKIGDYVICQKGSGGRCDRRSPQNQSGETTFAKLAEASSEALGVRPVEMPISAPDFHGDGADNEICNVWSYGALSGERHAALAQLIGELDFKRRDMPIAAAFYRGGEFQFFSSGFNSPARSGIGSGGIGLLAARPSGVKVFRPASLRASVNTPSSEGPESHIKLPSDFAGREFIGEVELDRVRMIRGSEAVSVFVHNLETPAGWYLADGIASHNCRSSQVPVTLSWDDLRGVQLKEHKGETYEALLRGKLAREGLSQSEVEKFVAAQRQRFAGSSVPESATLEDWLGRHTDADLDEMLGPGRAKLFREGRITASQLTDQRNRPLTLAQLKNTAK